MGRKLYIALALTVVLFLGAVAAAYAWDSSRADQIAEGVKIGSVHVGGMTAAEAERAVSSELVEPLDKRLVVTYDGVKYKLSAERLAIRSDVKGTVARALEASQEGGLPNRVWRYITGGEVNESIEPEVRYDRSELKTFVDQVAEAVNRDPVNASVEPTATSIEPMPSEKGLSLRTDDLRERLELAVQSPDHRRIKAKVDNVEPELTREDLAAQYPVYLTVSRSNFELKLWKNLELAKTYTVAIGAQGYDTPAGLYSIQNKAVDPAWSVPDRDWAGDLAGTVVPGGDPDNPLKERWLGIYDGAGIHGTDATGSLGSAASHGCVRMAIPDVIELYDEVPVGTPIYIG